MIEPTVDLLEPSHSGTTADEINARHPNFLAGEPASCFREIDNDAHCSLRPRCRERRQAATAYRSLK